MSHSDRKRRPEPGSAGPGQKARGVPGQEDHNDVLCAYRSMRACVTQCAQRAADDLQARAAALRDWAART